MKFSRFELNRNKFGEWTIEFTLPTVQTVGTHVFAKSRKKTKYSSGTMARTLTFDCTEARARKIIAKALAGKVSTIVSQTHDKAVQHGGICKAHSFTIKVVA